MKRSHIIALAVVALAVLAFFTVLSRRWWAKRIRTKYAEALKDRPGVTEDYLAREFKLQELAALWVIGNPDWDYGDPDAFGTFDQDGNPVQLG